MDRGNHISKNPFLQKEDLKSERFTRGKALEQKQEQDYERKLKGKKHVVTESAKSRANPKAINTTALKRGPTKGPDVRVLSKNQKPI